MNDENVASICIPIRDELGNESSNMITLPLEDLPQASGAVGPLKAEKADLSVWLTVAVEYLRVKKTADFEVIMSTITDVESEKYYLHDLEGRKKLIYAFAHYLIESSKRQKPKAKEKSLGKAQKLIKRIPNGEEDHRFLILKGAYFVAKSQYVKAMDFFEKADKIVPYYWLAKLGIARCLFENTNYNKSLDVYKEILLGDPDCSVSVRVGLGLCYYNMGSLDRAKECFERCLELDPLCVEALLSLAVIKIAAANEVDPLDIENERNKLLEEALEMLSIAYQNDENNPIALNHLANHLYRKNDGQFERIRNMSKTAFNNTENKAVKAESLYILGRNYHAQASQLEETNEKNKAIGNLLQKWAKRQNENKEQLLQEKLKLVEDIGIKSHPEKDIQVLYDKARSTYAKAIEAWPDFLLPHYGLAQLEYQQMLKPKKSSEQKLILAKIETHISTILKHHPQDRDSHYFLAEVTHRLGKSMQALSHLNKVVETHPDDFGAWIDLARKQHTNKSGNDQALKSYTEALLGYEEHGKQVPYEVLSNTGVLKYNQKDFLGAEQDLKAALYSSELNIEICELLKIDPPSSSPEASGFILTLEKVSVYYNLARVKEKLGKFNEAEQIYKEIGKKFPYYIKSSLRLGMISFKKGNLKQALKFFNEARHEDANSVLPLLLLYITHVTIDDKKVAAKRGMDIIKLNKDLAFHRLTSANLGLSESQSKRHFSSSNARDSKNNSSNIKGAIDRAFEIYHVVTMGIDKLNIFGANGMACVSAVEGCLDESQKLFEKIKEHSSSLDEKTTYQAINKNIYKNLGHISVLKRKFENAVLYYEQCLKRYTDETDFLYVKTINDKPKISHIEEMRNCLANAHCLSKNQASAKNLISKNLRNNPSDIKSWYNLAVSEYHDGSSYLDSKFSYNRTTEGYGKALGSIKRASNFFGWLSYTKTDVNQKKDDSTTMFVQQPLPPLENPAPNQETQFTASEFHIAKANKSRLAMLNASALKALGIAVQIDPEEQPAEEKKNMRSIEQRAPTSFSFAKKEKAVEAELECRELLHVWSQQRDSLRQKEKRMLLRRQKIEQENEKLERERQAEKRAEMQRKSAIAPDLEYRMKLQAEHNEQIRRKLQERKMQRAYEQQKAGRKKKRPDMDGFIVEGEVVDGEVDDKILSSSESDDESVFGTRRPTGTTKRKQETEMNLDTSLSQPKKAKILDDSDED